MLNGFAPSHCRAEEERCLAEADRIMTEWKDKAPVAGVIVEPIQVCLS